MFQIKFIDLNDHELLFYIKYLYYCNPFSRKMEKMDLIFYIISWLCWENMDGN